MLNTPTLFLLSLSSPVYCAFQDYPYYYVIPYAVITAVIIFFLAPDSKESLENANETAYSKNSEHPVESFFGSLLIVIAISALVTVLHLGLYYLVSFFI